MRERDDLARRFEDSREHLLSVAQRMLGSEAEAEDAVQESWLRFSRADTSDVGNVRGWLTTVVSRVCLDMLRSRESRREEPLDASAGDWIADDGDPEAERELVLADSMGAALLLVLQTLPPAERLAFVLHDLFAVPFEEIARILERSPAAARQLASRGRRRVQGAAPTGEADRSQQRRVVDAFLAASREGDFAGLLRLLHPDVVVRADAAAVQTGASAETRGADAVARFFAGRARAAQPAVVGEGIGLVWAPGGNPRVVFRFTIADERVLAIDLVAAPEAIAALAPRVLER